MDRIDDAYNGLMGEEFMRKTRERLHWMCSKVAGEKILDVGCSQGTLARLLAPLGKSVLGVDINQDAISYAEGKLPELDVASRERLRFVAMNFMDFKSEERFDTIVMGEILEHLPDPAAFVKKACTHLVKGGTIVATVPFGINDDPDHRQTFYWSWIRDIVAPLFDIRDIEFFGKWIGVVGTRRERRATVENAVPIAVVKELEKAFFAIERPLVDDNKARGLKLKAQSQDLAEAKKGLDAKTAEAQTAMTAETAQKARADKALADYAKLKTDLSSEIARQKDALAKVSADKDAELAKQKASIAKLTADKAAVDAAAAKQKTVLEGEVARQKTALAAEQAKIKDLNSKLAATRNELAATKNEALELRVNLDADRRISDGQAEQISVLKAALQFAANRPQVETNDTRLLEYSQEVRELRSALESKRDEAVERAERLGHLLGQVESLKAEKELLSSRVAELTATLAAERETVKSKDAEIAARDALVAEANDYAKLCEGENTKLAEDNKALVANVEALKAEKNAIAESLRASESENERKDAAIHRIASERTDFEQRVALLGERVKEKERELEAASREIKNGQSLAEGVQDELNEAKRRIEGLSGSLERSRDDAAQAKRVKAEVERRLARCEEDVKSLERQLDVQRRAMEMSKADLDVATKREEEEGNKFSQAVVQLKQANAKIAALDVELAKAKVALSSEQKKTAEQAAALKQANDACAAEGRKLAAAAVQMKERDAQIQSLRKENKSLSVANDKLGKRLHRAEHRYDILSKSKLGRLTLAYWRIKDSFKSSFVKQQQTHKLIPSPTAQVNPYSPAIERMRDRLRCVTSGNLFTYKGVSNFLKGAKVACIMDEFTWKSYSPEADMIQLVPENYESQLNEFRPEIVFVESAWRGVDNKWTNCVHKIPDELKGILSWAKGNGVPTVFWNKEDPIHFDTFKNVASLFDFIFTYDFNCVQKYRQITGKDNAFFLPMAVQPTMFNPIEKYERKDAFCFAGSYYKRYVERTKDLDGYIREFPKYKAVEIYDRQFGKNDPNYMMPPEYAPYIKGNLPYDEIDKAYKGYSVAINLNSIKQANSIARRVFELLACNTATVSNYSYGVVTGFGDLVITSDNADVVLETLKKYEKNPRDIDKLKLLGLRKVFSENTYRDRFAYICSKILGVDLASHKPVTAVVAVVRNEDEYQSVKKSFGRQNYEGKRLFVLSEGKVIAEETVKGVDDLLRHLDDVDYVGMMSPFDYYSDSYMEDMVYAFRYSSVDAVGKGSYFRCKRGKVALQSDDKPYSKMRNINLCRGFMTVEAFAGAVCRNPRILRGRLPEVKIPALSIDMFNYCENGALEKLTDSQVDEISDLKSINKGFCFSEMQKVAETLKPIRQKQAEGMFIGSAKLYDYCRSVKCKNVEQTFENGRMILLSELGKDEHVYFPIDKEFLVDDIPIKEGAMCLNQEVGCPSSVSSGIAYFFYDAQKKKISSAIGATNVNLTVDIPKGAKFVKFQFRLQGSGTLEIGSLNFSHKPTPLPYYFDSGKILCLTNHYPSYDNIYRNGFVHTRIKLYGRKSVKVPVFQLSNATQVQFSEFEGINVISGNSEYLRFVLESNRYSTILVHFLDGEMWEVLKELPETTRIIVWCHGAEVLKYTRRLFNFEGMEIPANVIAQSEVRGKFWGALLRNLPKNIHFVFVSQWMKDIVDEDYFVKIPLGQYSIINNPINTELFQYVKKDAEQRYHILSIRPYATRKYANDLSVKCILELSKRPDFKKFEITMIGDGKLFDDVLAPLRGYENVHILRTFLRQGEIYEYHKKNGIFLVPTRQDSQGVSKDEAMSSGLIPVTNDVTAMSEFVDQTCGVLSPSEDYEDMARNIGKIVDDPQLFQSMSKAAAERVRRQTASNIIVKKELSLICLGGVA